MSIRETIFNATHPTSGVTGKYMYDCVYASYHGSARLEGLDVARANARGVIASRSRYYYHPVSKGAVLAAIDFLRSHS
jgi:hypothetical protein